MNKQDKIICIRDYLEFKEECVNQNPIMIKKIQDECICFRENNYTNVLNNC